MPPKPATHRKPKAQRREVSLRLQVTAEEAAAIVAAADKELITVSTWLRRLARQALGIH